MIQAPSKPLIIPNENDILLGRGGRNNKHEGNEQLREMARKEVAKYCTCSKKEKSNMKIELANRVKAMNPPGRFLRKDKDLNQWIEVTDITAYEKTSQALRDAVLEQVKKNQPNSEEDCDRPLTPPLSSEGRQPKPKKRRRRIRPQSPISKPTLLTLDEPPLPPPQVPRHWTEDYHTHKRRKHCFGSSNLIESQQYQSLTNQDETILVPWNDPCWSDFVGLFL